MKAGDALLTREAAENSTLLKSNTLENLQWICFNLPATDKILFGGVVYDGNAKIWLRQADLASANLTFRYYQGDYAKVDSVMTTAIDRTALYLDANRNGRIDGWYNEATGHLRADAGGRRQRSAGNVPGGWGGLRREHLCAPALL